jgi:hypothetical protein
MSRIKRFFKKLVGGEPDEEMIWNDEENLRRMMVRTGNLDWQGKPIDRDRGKSMAPRGHRKLVDSFLRLAGLEVERNQSPGIHAVRNFGAISAIFHADASRQAATQAATRGRLPASDAWLHQGGGHGGPPQGHRGTGDDWLRR